MKIAILSGKGGTGKTSVTASLAVLLSRKNKIVTVDCDVDAPNLALILGLKNDDFISWQDIQTNEKAYLIKEKCIKCKKCLPVCNFNAITWNSKENIPEMNQLLCEGCGACQLICESSAIELKKIQNAKLGIGKTKYGFYIVSGQLKMGESGSGKIVSVVKNKCEEIAKKEIAEIILVDSAAGIGCPVIASIKDADFGIIVVEPNLPSINGMKRSISILNHFGIKHGVIINKYSINENFTKKIEEFLYKSNIQLLGKLPYDKNFVNALVNLKPVVVYDKKIKKQFLEILKSMSL